MVYDESPKNNKMVTAYGHISERDLTYALSNLKNENNKFVNYQDIFAVLETFAGVTINRSTFPPDVKIRRSFSIMGDTKPLFIINGITTDIDFIADISPDEIREISIIKDSAAAIYGSRGANGVVLIELK